MKNLQNTDFDNLLSSYFHSENWKTTEFSSEVCKTMLKTAGYSMRQQNFIKLKTTMA